MELYLWECQEGHSVWWRLLPPQGVQLPSPADRERTVDSVFHTHTVSWLLYACSKLKSKLSSGENLAFQPILSPRVNPFYQNKGGGGVTCSIHSRFRFGDNV